MIGFYAGVYFHSFFTNYYNALNSPYNFNFILIAMAVGGVFLLPTFKLYSLPVYTLPFNFITILVIFI
ncbi:urea transporter [Lebetimonas sp. JH292]|uniref:urea transporter n=1 Tax=Lebetimonas sp. JH292 TaxID=990068 RepID=UPI0004BCC0D5|nr:urea transporter [Lebetimonas sp. JH292]